MPTNIGNSFSLATSSRVGVNLPLIAMKVWLSQVHRDTKSSRSLWILIYNRSLEQLRAFFTLAWYIFFVTPQKTTPFTTAIVHLVRLGLRFKSQLTTALHPSLSSYAVTYKSLSKTQTDQMIIRQSLVPVVIFFLRDLIWYGVKGVCLLSLRSGPSPHKIGQRNLSKEPLASWKCRDRSRDHINKETHLRNSSVWRA